MSVSGVVSPRYQVLQGNGVRERPCCQAVAAGLGLNRQAKAIRDSAGEAGLGNARNAEIVDREEAAAQDAVAGEAR